MENRRTSTELAQEKAKSRFASVKTLVRNRPFMIFLLGDIIIGFAFEVIDYPLIAYALSLGFDVNSIGQLTSAGIITMVIFQIPAGILTDRMGRKNSIMLGLCMYAIFPVFYPLSNTWIPFVLIAAFSGVANAILLTASFTFVAEIVSRESRATAMVMTYFVSGILTFGPFVGGVLYSLDRALPFVVCSLLTVITICIFYTRIKPSASQNTGSHRVYVGTRDVVKTLKRPLIGVSVANLAYSFGAGILFLLGFLYIMDTLGNSMLLTGLALIFPQLVSLILSPFIGQWMDRRLKRKKFLVFGLVGYGGATFAFALLSGVLEAILVWTVLVVMATIIGSSSTTMVAEMSEEDTRGISMAVYSLFGAVGMIISLQLAGHLQRMYGSFQKPFFIVSLLCLLAALLTMVVTKEGLRAQSETGQERPDTGNLEEG